MSEVIIPKPGKIYNDYICQGSDGNYYVKDVNGNWVKVAGTSERYIPIDCSTNPLCPVAKAGDKLLVTAAGRFGGNNGIKVDKGDVILCYTDNNKERNWEGNFEGLADSSFLPLEHNIDLKDSIEKTAINIIRTETGVTIKDASNNLKPITASVVTPENYMLQKIKLDVFAMDYRAGGTIINNHYAYIDVSNSIETNNGSIILKSLDNTGVDNNHSIITIVKNSSAYTIRCYGSNGEPIDEQQYIEIPSGAYRILIGYGYNDGYRWITL